jgi:hypothetical protein
MSKSQFFIAASLAVVSTVSVAGTFDGPSIQAGIGINAAQTTLKDYSPDGKVSDAKVVGNLSLNYSKSYGAFNMAGGVFTMLGSQKSGSLRSFAEDTGGVWSDDFKLSNVWGISIEPGYNLNDSVQAYTKFSIVRATGKNTFDYTRDTTPDPLDAGSASVKHNGTGFGVGVKFKITKELYGTVEVEKINFNTKSYYADVPETYKPSLVKAGVSIGYKF